MKEKINETYESLQERLKSPFLLTFILVWAIHNWELLYGIFTFEESLRFVERIDFLKHYIRTYGTYHLFWFPLWWAFISLGLYLATSFISEGIISKINYLIFPFELFLLKTRHFPSRSNG